MHRTTVHAREVRARSQRARVRARTAAISAALAATVVTTIVAASTAPAANSSIVVTMDVPSSTVIDNDCTGVAATSLGVVQPGATSLTATGAGVCRVGFESSNDSVRLQVRQSDGAGTAMGRQDTTWGVGTIDIWHHEAIAAGSGSVLYADRDRQVHKSVDGGESWSVTWANGANNSRSLAVFAWDETRALIGHADGRIRYTSDGGATWPMATTVSVDSIEGFGQIDGDSAWAVGNLGLVQRSDDFGATWTIQATPTVERLLGASASGATGWVVGQNGVIIATTNGGTNWAAQASGVAVHLNDVEAVSSLVAVAVGLNGTIRRTTDGGTNWNAVAAGTTEDLHSIVETSSGALVASGAEGVVLRSTDAGASWAPIESDTKQLIRLDVKGDVVVGGGDNAMVVSSTDAGATFTRVDYGWEDAYDIELLDRQRHVVVGRHGMIRRSTDGGASFADRELPLTHDLNDVEILGDGRGWVAGDGGTIWRTTDSGNSWTAATSGVATDLRGVAWVGGSTVVVAGSGGLILRSTDGGSTWTSVASGTAQQLNGAASNRDGLSAWVAGGGGTILRTTDGGQTWSAQVSGVGQTLNEIESGGEDVLWIAANNETVLRTTDGGTTWQQRDTSSIGWNAIAAAGRDVAMFGGGVGRIGRSWDGLTSSEFSNALSRSTYAVDALSPNFWAASGNGGIYSVHDTTGGDITDYATGPNSWATAGSTSFFGVCLQAIGGAGAVADWTVDSTGISGQCEESDADPWRAVPSTASSAVRQPTAGVATTADFVFGVRATDMQPPGRYFAGITFEVVAPMA